MPFARRKIHGYLCHFIHQRFIVTHFILIASIVLMGLLFWIIVMAISWLFASCVIMREAVSWVFNMAWMGFFLSKCRVSCLKVKPGVPSASLISSYIKGMSTSVQFRSIIVDCGLGCPTRVSGGFLQS